MANKPIRCFEGSAKAYEPFWTVRNAAETGGEPEIELYGVISEYSWYGDEVTPGKFKDDLYKVGGGGPVTIRINSGGGDVIAASVMRSILLDYPGQKTMRVDGICASAATIVALAGDKIRMLDTSYMMIHDPGYVVFMAWLDIETLAGLLKTLEAIKVGILDAYAHRTGLSADRLSRMMRDETWMAGSEAVKLGFADEVISAGSQVASADNKLLQNYVHVPAQLLSLKVEQPPVDLVAVEAERLSDFAQMFLA